MHRDHLRGALRRGSRCDRPSPADETQQQAPPPGPPRDQAPGPAQHRCSPRRGQQRAEVGHWEGDQIIGKANRSSMQLLTERVTRYSIGVTMPEGYADGAMLAGLADGLDRIPPHLLRSITFDQGSEWGCSETVASTYGMDVWFSDPHSPWQRVQVENLNRQWRFWFPWGTDLASVARAHVDHVASIVNGQRRRSLGYQSPAALHAAAAVQ
ncbi:MAG: IS30 family transposase [Acidimicrobiales bacterium]